MSENQRKWYDKVKHASGKLELIRQNIREDDVQAIAEALKANTSLRALDLRENQIGDAGAQAIAEALKLNTTLTELGLGQNQIGDAGAHAIAETLKSNTMLAKLSLRRNQIGDAGAQAIAEALRVNTTLTELGFGCNHVGDPGAKAIAEAFKVNTTMTGLGLSENAIGDAGAQAVAEALKVNTALNWLFLHQNQIGDAGARAIAEVLKVNKKLRYLYLSNNFITNVGITALRQTGNTICQLDFCGHFLENRSVAQSAARVAADVQPQASVNLETEIHQLRSELATKDEELAAQDQELAAQDEELAAKDQELAAKDQQLRSKLAAKDQKFNSKLAARDQQSRSELAAKDKELQQLRSNLAVKDKELATKRQELKKLRSDLAAKEQSLATKEQNLAAKDRELKSALDRIDVFERNQPAVGSFSSFDGPIPQVPLATLVVATSNFAADSLLGKGAFGCVYGTRLPGPRVAIKRLSTDSKQGAAEFKAELDSLSKFRHANIIAILSYAEEGDERCLVYEFMPNGSVRDRLDRKNHTPPLIWSQRHRIAADVSRGMHYVQTAFPDHTLFHLDLKTDNVLLDAYFNAKVSDFGLVRIATHLDEQSYQRTQHVQGTKVYMCPEFFAEGKMTIKTDVHSFGMILLELVTAAKPGPRLKAETRKAVKTQKINEMLDSALRPTRADRNRIKKTVTLALECLDDIADDRPSFGQLIATLDP